MFIRVWHIRLSFCAPKISTQYEYEEIQIRMSPRCIIFIAWIHITHLMSSAKSLHVQSGSQKNILQYDVEVCV